MQTTKKRARRRGFPYSEKYLPAGARLERAQDKLEVSLDGRDPAGLLWILLGLGLVAMAIFIPVIGLVKVIFLVPALALMVNGTKMLFRRFTIAADRSGLRFGSGNLSERHIPLDKLESIGIRRDRDHYFNWSPIPFVYGWMWSRASIQPGNANCYLRITTSSRKYSFANGSDLRELEWLQGLLVNHIRSLKGERKKG